MLPFGALTIFHEKVNKPLKEEFIILIMGPLFQLIGTYFLYQFFGSQAIQYSLVILSFNLLPVFPLDGARLINIILNKITNFKTSHLLTLYISLITILFLIFHIKFSLLFVLIMIFIILKVWEEFRNHNNLFNLFLLERYNYNMYFPHEKIIKGKNLQKMKRDYRHIFNISGKYITEKQALRQRFDINYKV